MRHYENTALGDLSAALDGLEIRFKDSNDVIRMIEELGATHEVRHGIYDDLVDSQQDTPEEPVMWDRADERRKTYDSLLVKARNLRKDLIETLEESILGGVTSASEDVVRPHLILKENPTE